jgi:uncharacterized protein (TIGR04255 family)
MPGTLTLANPPIVELVLGAQFSPLTRLTAGHFGLFWKDLVNDWSTPEDKPLVEDQQEVFEGPRWTVPKRLQLRLEPAQFPGRFALGHKDKDRLVQIQPTRFHLNWRKREGVYPSYRRMIVEFFEMFSRFGGFAERMGLGPLELNQWELTYVDSFPQGEYWVTPADWPTFLPGLFGALFATDDLGVVLEHRTGHWGFEIHPKRGRLHITAGPGHAGEDRRDTLLLQMTARGPTGKGGVEALRNGLDLGHEKCLGAFLRMTPHDLQKSWGLEP